MLPCNVLESQQSEAAVHPAARTVAGAWKLLPGHAISLRPRQRTVLEIATWRVWLTAQVLSGRATVDQVLCAGEQITVERGQHVVMEPWHLPGAEDARTPVAFRWDVAAAVQAAAPVRGADWETCVALPLRDLGGALHTGRRALGTAMSGAASAGGRLILGMARWALMGVASGVRAAPAVALPAAPCADTAIHGASTSVRECWAQPS